MNILLISLFVSIHHTLIKNVEDCINNEEAVCHNPPKTTRLSKCGPENSSKTRKVLAHISEMWEHVAPRTIFIKPLIHGESAWISTLFPLSDSNM